MGELEAAEQQRILARLDQLLKVYPLDADGKYDWYGWQSESLAQFVALELVRYPEYWPVQIDLATRSVHALRVVQLLVENLYDVRTMDLIIAPNQGPRGEDGFEWSPLFFWMVGVAIGKRPHPRSRKGPDPAALQWRDLAIWHTLNALCDAGLSRAEACQLVADHVADRVDRLGADRVHGIWKWGRRLSKALRGKKVPTLVFPEG